MNDAERAARWTTGATALRVVVANTAKEAEHAAVLRLAHYIAQTDEPFVGLATGRTFEPVFALLRERAHELELARATFTHLDEYADLAPGAQGSMAEELQNLLLGGLAPAPRFLPVDACGAEAAQKLAATRKRQAPGFQFAGLGANGHIAFNEPGTSLAASAARVQLAADTVAAQGQRFEDGRAHTEAITMGPQEILATGELVMLVTGKAKAGIVRAMLEGPVSSACPASLVRLHGNATVLLDAAAASELRQRGKDRVHTPFEIRTKLQLDGPLLCVAPHPDDASISCGAALALAAGARKIILGATTGARAPVRGVTDPAAITTLREQELAAEARLLGCEARFLRAKGYDSGGVEDADVARATALLLDIRPALIQLPSPRDPHPTHRMTRHLFEAALHQARLAHPDWRPEIWTFEGPWFQHATREINLIIHHTGATEALKLAAIRAHASQLARVPFDDGAKALTRLRGTQFSEMHFGGLSAKGMTELPLLECYVREQLC